MVTRSVPSWLHLFTLRNYTTRREGLSEPDGDAIGAKLAEFVHAAKLHNTTRREGLSELGSCDQLPEISQCFKPYVL